MAGLYGENEPIVADSAVQSMMVAHYLGAIAAGFHGAPAPAAIAAAIEEEPAAAAVIGALAHAIELIGLEQIDGGCSDWTHDDRKLLITAPPAPRISRFLMYQVGTRHGDLMEQAQQIQILGCRFHRLSDGREDAVDHIAQQKRTSIALVRLRGFSGAGTAERGGLGGTDQPYRFAPRNHISQIMKPLLRRLTQAPIDGVGIFQAKMPGNAALKLG
jgi:hypothetical protein